MDDANTEAIKQNRILLSSSQVIGEVLAIIIGKINSGSLIFKSLMAYSKFVVNNKPKTWIAKMARKESK